VLDVCACTPYHIITVMPVENLLFSSWV